MAIPVARVHLKVAHAALPALLPTPPKWKMLPRLPTPPPCIAATLPKPPLAKPSRADSNERRDARKTKPASAEPSASSSSSGSRSAVTDGLRSSAVHGSSPRKNATSPPPKPCRADSVERWDANKKAASPASSFSSSSSGTYSLESSSSSSSKWPISRASSAERWDVHKTRRPPQPQAEPLDDGESSSTGSNDIDTEEEEEILWKPRAMYAGPCFAAAAPEPIMLPMPAAFLLRVA